MENQDEVKVEIEEQDLSKNMIDSVIAFFKDLLFVDDVDKVETVKSIEKDVTFRGFNIWILICSILICSIGLNQDSTAVIIGAMLISPLMGPITGLGLSIGIYDRSLFFTALKNLLIAVVISIGTSFIFFKVMPPDGTQHELLSRTKPIFLDLFVALFGGIAGILAGSRSIKTNVIPGVAIATALMPPLCTAGYGLATGHWDFFGGALYLFFINSVMISVAAFLIVRYLRFPFKEYVNSRKRTRVKVFMFVVIILVSIPSIFIYLDIYRESQFKRNANEYIQHEILDGRDVELINRTIALTDSGGYISIGLIGQRISEEEEIVIKHHAKNYGLDGCRVKLYQMGSDSLDQDQIRSIHKDVKVGIVEELYTKNAEMLSRKQDEIAMLKSELEKLAINRISKNRIHKLFFSQFDLLESFVLSDPESFENQEDSLNVVFVKWKRNKPRSSRNRDEVKMVKLLEIETEDQKWKAVSY